MRGPGVFRGQWKLSRRTRLIIAVVGGSVGVALAALNVTWLTLAVFGLLGLALLVCLLRGAVAKSRRSRHRDAVTAEQVGSA
jgi:hypothetical protein